MCLKTRRAPTRDYTVNHVIVETLTYKIYEQPPLRCLNSDFQSHFSLHIENWLNFFILFFNIGLVDQLLPTNVFENFDF